MKNIDISAFEENKVNRIEVIKYLEGNVIHLREDFARFTKKGDLERATHFADLLATCTNIQDKTINNINLDKNDLKKIEEINNYNTTKNIEMRRFVIFTAVTVLIGAIITTLFK